MSRKLIEHIACTYPDCGSSDGMAVYEGDKGHGPNGYCFVCNRYEANPYGSKPVDTTAGSYRHIVMEASLPPRTAGYFESISEYPITADLSRSILQPSNKYFGVRSSLSQLDGTTPTEKFYPYTRDGKLVAYKVRKVENKDFHTVGDFKNADLFGQQQATKAGGKRIFITEGEEDAIALYQALKEHARGTQWAHLDPAVVSIPTGAASAVKALSAHMSFLKKFEQIVLVFDQDTPGKEAVDAVLKLIPEALVATLDEKDPNDMVIKGKSNQLAKAVLFNAKAIKPSSVVGVSSVLDRALSKPTMGLSWPWPSLTKATYGIHTKRLYGLGAGVGLGKSEFAKQLQAHIVSVHGSPIGLFNFEEDVGRSLKGIAGKIDGVPYHVPDIEYDERRLRATVEQLDGKVLLFDHYGSKDWSDVRAGIRYMVVAEGIKHIFLDPMTALIAHLSSTEANEALNAIMSELSGMVHELDFTLYYFCHLNPPTNGPPHERGGKVVEQQFTGSRAMMR